MLNFEIQNIKINLDDQDQIFKIELNGLRQIITIKNEQIGKLLMSIKQQSVKYEG